MHNGGAGAPSVVPTSIVVNPKNLIFRFTSFFLYQILNLLFSLQTFSMAALHIPPVLAGWHSPSLNYYNKLELSLMLHPPYAMQTLV